MTDAKLTAAEAAEQLGVARATIDTWVHRGALAPIPGSKRPHRFWFADVLEAEATRDRRKRRSPATIRAKDPM